jgi:hypothetical protein
MAKRTIGMSRHLLQRKDPPRPRTPRPTPAKETERPTPPPNTAPPQIELTQKVQPEPGTTGSTLASVIPRPYLSPEPPSRAGR